MSQKAETKVQFGINQIFPIFSAATAVVFIWLGLTKYGFWHSSQGPLPGFYPTIIGFGLLAASILGFIFSFKDKTPILPKENWLAALGALAIIAAAFIIGLIASVSVYVLVWLRWYEKMPWKTTIITFIVIMAIVVGAFVVWLQVPFPRGVLFDAILK